MAAGIGRDARRQAAIACAGLDRPAACWRAHGLDDDAGSRRIQRQGQAWTWLAAGLSLLAYGICRDSPAASHALGGVKLRQPSQWLALEPGVDAVDHLGIVAPEILLGGVAEMRSDHHVVELAEGMIDRQRLDREHVDAGARDLLLLQHLEERRLVDDRTARGIDDIGGRLHAREILAP